MLHILWLILKIILILLAIILGIVLLILLLVLFCPIRYRVYAEKAEEASFKEASAKVRVSWLFGGISANGVYENGSLSAFLKLFFLKKGILPKKEPSEGKQESEKKPPEITYTEDSYTEASHEEDSHTEVSHTEVSHTEASAGESDAPPVPVEIEPVPAAQPVKPAGRTSGEKKDPAEDLPDEGNKEVSAETVSVPAQKQSRESVFSRISGKIRRFKEKRAAARQRFEEKMTTVNWWKDFVFHPKTKAAAALVLKEAGFLIRHILPTNISGRLKAGFEDPSITGRMLAFLGMSYPLHKNCVAVSPVFENRTVIDGEVTVKGRIYLIVFAAAAVKIILSRNVRFVLKTFKNRNK